MQRTQAGSNSNDSGASAANLSGDSSDEFNPRTLIQGLDDAIEENQPLRGALIFVEHFDPTDPGSHQDYLLRERAARILAAAGRDRAAARVWEQLADYWKRAGQPARAIAAMLHLKKLSAPYEASFNEFSEFYNIRSEYLDATARIDAVKSSGRVVSFESVEVKLQAINSTAAGDDASSSAREQLLGEVLDRALVPDAMMLEKPAPGTLPPLSLVSLLPAGALRRVLELMTLRRVARGEIELVPGEHRAGLVWTVNQDFCIESDALDSSASGGPSQSEADADSVAGDDAQSARLRVPSGALLGLHSFGPAVEASRFAVTNYVNGEILCLSEESIATLDSDFGDFSNRLTTLRRHALSEGFLESHELFLQAEPSQRADLMRKFSGLRVTQNEVLIEQDGLSSGLFLVLDGQVDVVVGEDGQERRVESLRSGDVFGAICVVSDRAAMARYVMATAGHMLFLSTSKFGQAAAEMPGVAKYAVKCANQRIQKIEAALEGSAPAPVEEA